MTNLELMNIHCDTLYIQSDTSELICANDWLRQPAPVFWMGFTPEGVLWRFRKDVPNEIREQIEYLIEQETASEKSHQRPVYHDSYCQLLGRNETIAGPTYWLPTFSEVTRNQVIRITENNTAIFQNSKLKEWIPDIPYQQPMFALLEEGHAVAVCSSVRITAVAHQAGVETLPSYRCRGHATSVVSAWAKELLRVGVVPLYSTSWDNQASQGVAQRLGFQAFGWEYRIG